MEELDNERVAIITSVRLGVIDYDNKTVSLSFGVTFYEDNTPINLHSNVSYYGDSLGTFLRENKCRDVNELVGRKCFVKSEKSFSTRLRLDTHNT